MAIDWAQVRQAYAEAAGWFQATVAQVGDRWDLPALGEWDVRALVGHTSRALLTVEAYVARPAPAVAVESAVAYYRATRAMSAGPAVAKRGTDAGFALGDDPVGAVAEIADRVLDLVGTLTGDEIPTTIAGGMRLRDYLLTRVFELTVHTADLATALELAAEPPPAAAAVTLQAVCDLALAEGRSGSLLLGATGRGLPAGFTVL